MWRQQHSLRAMVKVVGATLSSLCLVGIGSFVALRNAWAAPILTVQTTTTELSWLAQEIGKDSVRVQSFLSGTENPHYADATPSFALKAKQADLLLAVGLDLEVGWLPRTLQRARNQKLLRKDSGGYCEVASEIEVKGKIEESIDRSMGHLHAQGNPHFWYSIEQMRLASQKVLSCLIAALPAPADATLVKTWNANHAALLNQFDAEAARIQRIVKTRTERAKVFELHADFDYVFDELGLISAGTLEEKPGLKPSAGRLSKMSLAAKDDDVRLLLLTSLDSQEIGDKFSELSGLPTVVFQAHLKRASDGSVENYFKVYRQNTERLFQALDVLR